MHGDDNAVSPLPKELPIIVATLLAENGQTGVQSHFNTFCSYLRQQGNKVKVVTPFHYYRSVVYPVFGLRCLIDRINGSAGVWWYRYWHYIFLKKALRSSPELSGPTVIYAQCPLSAKAALEIRADGQRVIMIAHFNISQADEWAEKRGIAVHGWVGRGIRRIEETVLPRLDGIIYVSQYMKQSLETRIAELKNIPSRVIPNSCVSRIESVSAAIQGDLITIGTLEPRKNQKFLLEVLAQAKRLGYRYTLTLIGDGPDRNALTRLAQELNIADQVKLLGNQPDAARFINHHRVYVHGATMESFGIVLAEAMAARRPVLAAPVGGIPEVFDNSIEGFYWSLYDPSAAAKILIKLLEDPVLYERMAKAAEERYRRSYSAAHAGADLQTFLMSFSQD